MHRRDTDHGAEVTPAAAVRGGGAAATTHRVFVADEYPLVREGVRGVLEATGRFEVIGDADAASVTFEAIIDLRPDLLVVAQVLGPASGCELVRDIRLRGSGCRSLVLAQNVDEASFCQALRAGAMGLLAKTDAPGRLVHACDEIMAGRVHLSLEPPEATRRHATHRSNGASRPSVTDFDLTPQETRILGFVAQGQTNREIAEELGLAEKTIRNYVSRVLGKMGMKNRTEAAAYVARAAAGRRPRMSAATS